MKRRRHRRTLRKTRRDLDRGLILLTYYHLHRPLAHEIPDPSNQVLVHTTLIFDAEIFAIYQALKTFEARGQSERRYTVLSDSQATIRWAMSDSLGQGQQWARAIIEVASRIRANTTKCVIWVPAHREVIGNEIADGMAKEAAGNQAHNVPNQIRWQISLPHLARRATERRTGATSQWIRAQSAATTPQVGLDLDEGFYGRSGKPLPSAATSCSPVMRPSAPSLTPE